MVSMLGIGGGFKYSVTLESWASVVLLEHVIEKSDKHQFDKNCFQPLQCITMINNLTCVVVKSSGVAAGATFSFLIWLLILALEDQLPGSHSSSSRSPVNGSNRSLFFLPFLLLFVLL